MAAATLVVQHSAKTFFATSSKNCHRVAERHFWIQNESLPSAALDICFKKMVYVLKKIIFRCLYAYQRLSQCHTFEYADCPFGLVCCVERMTVLDDAINVVPTHCRPPTMVCPNCWSTPCQIRTIAGAHAPWMPGTFSPPPRVSDPDMLHGTCVTHVPWGISGSLTCGFLWSRRQGKKVPGIAGACATHNFTNLVRGPWLLTVASAVVSPISSLLLKTSTSGNNAALTSLRWRSWKHKTTISAPASMLIAVYLL